MMPPADLTNCDREPIHIPGSIQPHGCLLALDSELSTILRASANAEDILGHPGTLLGRTLAEVVGKEFAHSIRNALATSTGSSRAALLHDVRLPGDRRFDIAVHSYRANVIVEFEPSASAREPLLLGRELIGRIGGIADTGTLLRSTARAIRALLDYDRVMVYRFEQDGAGKVVSEARRDDLESFLGQYFPQSDIPRQARELYLKNTIRIISDARGFVVPIEPALDHSGEALDLSFAHLRSVSPVHLEYLRNMGVAASMSISIIVDGLLWGMIACHHYQPKALPMPERVAAELFGNAFSLKLAALIQKRKLETAAHARRALERFLRDATAGHSDVRSIFADRLSEFRSLVPNDGVGLWMEGRWSGIGSLPPEAAVPALIRLIKDAGAGAVWATDAIHQKSRDAASYADVAAGVLAIPISQVPRDFILFFRKEVVQTLEWAGNPEKTYEVGPLGDRLTPRKSFAIWKETVSGRSQPWTDEDRDIAEATRSAAVEVVLRQNEILADERTRAEVRQRMLNEELNHRVKNILAVIKSLVGHPSQQGRSIAEFIEALKGRIHALSIAHDQVVRGDGGGDLRELLEAELLPYSGGARTSLEGPSVWLDSRAFSVMALVLHELATNAAKYGALSRPAGRLAIEWSVEQIGDCRLRWQESGGPLVKPPSREGFGSTLLSRALPYDLGGESTITYGAEGVSALLLVPARHVLLKDPPALSVGTAVDVPAVHSLEGRPLVLVVEDQMLIAMDIEDGLLAMGAGRVFAASSAARALEFLDRERPAFAILDVNLGTGTSFDVAARLQELAVPMVFATGYNDVNTIPSRFGDVPVVRKPYDATTAVAALARRSERASSAAAGTSG